MKSRIVPLLTSAALACTLPAAAQTYQIANSTSGSQTAAAPIRQAIADVNNYISTVDGKAGNALDRAEQARAAADGAVGAAGAAGAAALNNSNGRVIGTWQGSWYSGQGDQFQSGWANGICISGFDPNWIYSKYGNLTFGAGCPSGSGAYL